MDKRELTRWNRAGLTRFRYIDGNAATYLEDIRLRLAQEFTDWPAVNLEINEDESQSEKLERIEELYNGESDDLLWNISRSFARSAHVLTETMDAYGNEAKLTTANQWDSVRKMVSMLDYHPHPPASAFTSLVFQAKGSGTLETGFQVKHSPEDGSAPVVFETLEDMELAEDLNEIRPRNYDRNMNYLFGGELILDQVLDDLAIGEPLVLENEHTGDVKAYFIDGVRLEGEQTRISVTPNLSSSFQKGYTWVHLLPKERLDPLSPLTSGAQVGKSLYLTTTTDLTAGEVVLIATTGKKPYYRRLKGVEETKLSFYNNVGELDLVNATASRPVTVAVNYQGERSTSGNAVIHTLYIAGDWSYLIGQWLCDIRRQGDNVYLPLYQVIHTNYRPVGSDPGEGEAAIDTAEQFSDYLFTARSPDGLLKEGYTAVTVGWHRDTDGVPGNSDYSLDNPQSLLVPANMAGTWQCDPFLQKSNDGHLPDTLVTSQPKKTTAGDLAVLTRAGQMAWCRLKTVSLDMDAETAALEADNGWQDRGGGPFYLTLSRVYSQFKEKLRLLDWEINKTALSGSEIPLAVMPSALTKGRNVIVQYGEDLYYKTSILDTHTVAKGNAASVTTSPPYVTLSEALPQTVQINDVILCANVISSGHGVTRNTRVLGSGDATKNNQSFIFAVDDLSFEADSDLASGVRAAIAVQVGDRTWQQVSSLKDSLASDSHYTVRMTEDKFIRITFGDGKNGRRAPSGSNNIRISYRQGVGTTGNLSTGSLIKAVKPHHLVDSVSQPLPASGGGDMEQMAALKTNAPAALLTLARCVSLRDFALLTKNHPSYAQAKAFSLKTGFGQRENIEVVVVPAGGAELTTDLQTSLVSFLQSHALPAVSISVSAYEAVIVGFDVSVRVDSSAYDTDVVSQEVIAALTGAFSIDKRELGQALYRGELYQVVEGISGVENSTCELVFDGSGQTFSKEPRIAKGDNNIIRVIFPSPRQCIHLDALLPVINVTVEEYEL
ncbi:hypothetical protein SG34_019940 [Thalassomonas viridans]|uniref:Baseplate protein J-like domain-containing protein n=1 Tax=Thalassomonas viridans TaxID=137584 RepID=A0AAE9Z1S2_9GAMM|nr:hypothetical protein [Thalassomonas viridans]WDE03638.1 hypothetical protein SG34_019940 [Thalassomonas viridans]